MAAALLLATVASGQTTVQGNVTSTVEGRPVAGAVVLLQGPADAYMAETDREGRFQMEAVAPGRYQARPQREGFTLRTPVRLTVEAGAATRDLDLRLTPLAAVSGRVVDADGDPVSKIQVEAMHYSYASGRKQLETAGSVRTNDRGEYSIFGLAPGRYYLRASDPLRFSWTSTLRVLGPRPPTTYATIWFPTSLEPETAAALDLAASAELRDTDLRLRPQRTYTIRIRLAGSADETAHPTMTVRSPRGMEMMMDGRYGMVFGMPGMAPGTYRIEASDKKTGLAVRSSVKLVDSDLDVSLTLVPEVSLTGVVRVEGGGAASAGVRLEAEDSGNNTAVAVKPEGTFVILNIQPVVYTVRVDAPAGSYFKSLQLGEQLLPAPRIDAAHASGPLIVTLGTDGGTLTGKADEEGATVVAVPAWPELARTAIAGTDGGFEFRDLAPGDYKLFAWTDVERGAPLDPDFRRPFEQRAVSVHIAPHGSATIQLKAF
jgi:hypothetical protein